MDLRNKASIGLLIFLVILVSALPIAPFSLTAYVGGEYSPDGVAARVAPSDIFEKVEPNIAGGEYVPAQIVVKFKLSVSNQDINELALRHGCLDLYKSPLTETYVLEIPTGEAVAGMLKRFREEPIVEYATPNYVCSAFMTPNDPYYSYQWNFEMINMEQAWDIAPGGSASVVVAVLDTGVAYENYVYKGDRYQLAPDLAGTTFVPGYDFINHDAHPNDDNSHGTHVTGTIAQTTNNGLGVAGIAFKTAIMPVKVLGKSGSGTEQALADGIMWAADHGAHVISMSLGFPPSVVPTDLPTLTSAVQYAYGKGVVLVAASCNSGVGVVSLPAAYPEVIAVGAVHSGRERASYSQYGDALDFVAPGGDTQDRNGDGYIDGVLQQTFGNNPSVFGYYFFTGTSMATPHVSGVVALLIANGNADANGDGKTSPYEIRTVLQATAIDLGASGWDSTYGWGLIDANAAIVFANAPVAIQFTTSGMSSDASGTVLTIDSTAYTYTQLQSHTFNWAPSSTHTITASDPLSAGSGKRYRWMSWTNGEGLSGVGPGTYTVPASSQTVTANYYTQYYLTVNNGGHGTAGGANWYDAGTNAQATITPLTVPGSTGVQYVFTGWGGDAAGTTSPSNNILMNGPKTATANWKTQYQVSFDVSPIGGGSITNPPSSPQWYDAGATGVSISATPSTGYTFSSWASDTAFITFADAGIPSTTATIGGPGTITARFLAVMQNVLYMPFTDASVPIKDLSGYGNDGTPYGGVTWQSSYGGCYSFDGADDYIQVPNSPSLDVSKITVSAWIKLSTVASGERNISSKDYYTGWEFSQIGDGLKVNCRIGGTYYSNYLLLPGVLYADTWAHVVFTFDGSVGTIYVDGAPVATRSDVPGVLGVNNANLCVGSRSGSALFFDGLIDEVRVYFSALSGGDVQGLYDTSKADHA
jgi:serine protease